jgi:hypothetical protein
MSFTSPSANLSRALEQALKRDARLIAPPPGLHESIIGAVRLCHEAAPSDLRSNRAGEVAHPDIFWNRLLRWVPAPALGTCILFAFMTGREPVPGDNPSAHFATVATVLLEGADLTDSATESLMAPMAEEYRFLNEDISRTAAFLAACIP